MRKQTENEKMTKKLFVGLILMSFFLVFSISVRAESIGVFKQNENVQLYQTCNNCTYCNFTTVKYPNSTNILTNILTTKDETYYYYDLGEGNTTELGTWTYCYDCGNTVEKATGCLEFTISVYGDELTTSKGIMYMVFLIAGVLIFCLLLYGAIRIPYKNSRNEENEVISVNYMKYLKIFCIVFSYVSFMFLSGLLRGITASYIPEIGVDKFFNVLYWILLSCMYPLIVMSFLFTLIIFISDKKFIRAISRGLPEE